MSEMDIGMVGLGVMGRNLSLNIEEKGFSVAAWDAWPEPVDSFVAASRGKRIEGFHELADFVKSLRKPRRIIMLVKAGEVVDKTIALLKPLLEPGRPPRRRRQRVLQEHRAPDRGARGGGHPLLRHGRVRRRDGRTARAVDDAGR